MKIETTDDIEACKTLRRIVFIEEQGVSEAEEWDGHDREAIHLLAWRGYSPVGTARILIEGDVGKIGRVCVLKNARGGGLGAALIRAAMDELRARGGISRAKVSAQAHAQGFYERMGFVAHGPLYKDAGIPHRDMYRAL